jgi:hypothetical protein
MELLRQETEKEIKMLNNQLQEKDYEILRLKRTIERGKEDKEYHSRVTNREILKAKEEKALEIERLQAERQELVNKNDRLVEALRNNELELHRLKTVENELTVYEQKSATARQALENKHAAICQALQKDLFAMHRALEQKHAAACKSLEQKSAADQQVLEQKHAVAQEALIKANERLITENKDLTEYTLDLKKKLSALENDYDDYVKQTTSLRQADADARWNELKKENSKLRDVLKHQKDHIAKLTEVCERQQEQEARSHVLEQAHEVFLKKAKRNEQIKDEMIAAVSRDNEALRDIIVRKSRKEVSEPIHHDDYYVEQFEDLNNAIKNWAAKNSKANAKQTLNLANQTIILELIADLGPTAKKSAELLQPQLSVLYQNWRTRMPLIRHIFAIFLWEQILGPFAVGLDLQASRNLLFIEDDLFSQGNPTISYMS